MKLKFAMLFVLVLTTVIPVNKSSATPPETIKHRRHHHAMDNVPAGSTGSVTPPITYHGGPLISTPNIYYIWYGNWNQNNGSDNPAGKQVLRDLAQGLGGSPYFAINTTYSIPAIISATASRSALLAGKITGSVGFGGETSDSNSHGTHLDDSDILAIVDRAITNNSLPYDPNGVYFVLTSTNIRENSGFCTNYCGWHTSALASGHRIRYSFVGNANRCLSACSIQSTSPNNNPGVDAMASVIAHELSEATTDPDPISGWVDANGAENADKCAWSFGQNQSVAPNGSIYNMILAGRRFLLQRNLKHSSTGDTCNVDLTHQ